MIGTIIYVIGIVVTVMAVIDVFKKNISPVCKIGITIILLLTSWTGRLLPLCPKQNRRLVQIITILVQCGWGSYLPHLHFL